MRDALIPYLGQRLTVQAPVLRFSRCLGWGSVRQPTIMLGPVTLRDGQLLADHLWLHRGARLAALDLHLGDVVQFTARVARYRRGWYREPGQPATWSEEYGLLYPTHCTVLARAGRPRETALPPRRPRVLSTIITLWHEQGEPPRLPDLCEHTDLPPATLVRHLDRLARAGAIAFMPNGSIYVTTRSV